MLVVTSNYYNLQVRSQAISQAISPCDWGYQLVSLSPAMTLWPLDGEGVSLALILDIPTWCEQGSIIGDPAGL